ncbi:MAG: hypothetical protein CMH60_01120 [Myxococcales bacterium]|nr:hypothetical protein [Myxococcales bacterium]
MFKDKKEHKSRLLAQNYGFTVSQCSCSKVSLQVGAVTLHLEPDALLCLANVAQAGATEMIKQGGPMGREERQGKDDVYSGALQAVKDWVH